MKTTKIILTFLLLFLCLNIFADEEQSTFAYVKSAYGGRYFFVMLPHRNKYYNRSYGRGYAVAITRMGKQKILWRVKGWYAFKTFLSYDGVYLVRMGNWPRGRTPAKTHLAIAFYKRGKLIKAYSTIDLIKDLSKIEPSTSHYNYYTKIIGFTGYNFKFSFVTIENIRYIFDVRTGKIIASE